MKHLVMLECICNSCLGLIYISKYCHATYNKLESEWGQSAYLPSALWDAILREKNEKATWLELTWDCEATAALFSSHESKRNKSLQC